jgi:hypothetical protein
MCILEKRIADWDTNCGTKSRGLGVLQMAFAFEQARNLEKRKPVALD